MKKILLYLLLTLAVIVAIVLFRAETFFEDVQYKVKTPLKPIELDVAAISQRFAKAIQFPTISHDDRSNFDSAPFEALKAHLEQSYPLIYANTELIEVNDYSLVFHLKGQSPELKPALFMGHTDVVPVDEATRDQWKHAPFSGDIAEGAIWGRGTIDDKITVMALMEAMEYFLQQGITPKRSIYFSFGHDEEVGGDEGAQKIAAMFKEKGIEFEFILDEGGAVTKGLMTGVSQPAAIIGIAEKGFLNLRLTVEDAGGHSSQPPDHTAAGILAQAIVDIEGNPSQTSLKFINETFAYLGYYTGLETRLPMSNLWLLSPVVENALLSAPSSAASLRTTAAATMLKGSSKSNILPTQATAVVNYRILPGDSIEQIKARTEQIINNPRVKVETFMGNEPSTVSRTDSYGFRLIEQTIRRLDDEILVAPYLVQGGTDAKHFDGLSENIYRFMMVTLDPQSLKQFHGVNEHVTISDYKRAIQFYYALLHQAAMDTPLN